MKKKLGYLLLSLLLCFVLIENVHAEGINLELRTSSNSNSVVAGNYVDVKLLFENLTEGIRVDYCTFEIEASEGLEFKEIQALNSWVISNTNSIGKLMNITVKNNQNDIYGSFNIANIKYVVNDNGSIKINSSSCYDSMNNIVSSYNNVNNLYFVVANNTDAVFLKSLKINNEELNPQFSSEITSYNINNFTGNNISLEFEVNDSIYQEQVVVSVNDKVVNDLSNISYEVSQGNKAMLITITIADTTTYNIFVYKLVDNTLNNTLSSLTVNGESIEIIDGKYDYVYTVLDDVSQVEILAELSDSENFMFDSMSNAPATFDMNGKVTAIMNIIPINNQGSIPSVTYTLTVVNQSNSSDVNDNPQTSDTPMYVMALILLLSLLGSTVWYQKNLNSYK